MAGAAAGTGLTGTGLAGTGGGLTGKPSSPNSGCSQAAQNVSLYRSDIVRYRNSKVYQCEIFSGKKNLLL